MNLDLESIGTLIVSYFSEQKAQQVAYKTNFVQRSTAKLTGPVFLQAIVFACLEHASVTVSQIAQACLDLGVNISAQGIDERINKSSEAFMKEMFAQAMLTFSHSLALPLPILSQFKAVNIADSSIIPLPDGMVETYPGSGGNASAASLKVRLVFDFLRGNMQQLILAPGREPDQGFRDYLALAAEGSLNIIDLGHFNLTNFKELAARHAYFLSRYKHGTRLLTPQGGAIDLLKLLQSHSAPILDMPLRLGKKKKHQLPCRLIAFRLKPEVADQRRRKAKQAAKRRGHSISATSLALLGWSIYVTNVPQLMLTAEQVALLYRVRWQIELIFKLWKSYAGLREFIHLRPERVMTELYARLIGLTLTHFMVAPIRMPFGTQANREISPVQVRKIFQRSARALSQVLGNLDQVRQQLSDLMAHILRFGFKQKRQKKPNICHALALASTIYQLQFTPNHEFELVTCQTTC